MRKPAKLPLKILLFGVYGVVLLLWLWLDLPCLFRAALSIICPGCGMSRAYLSLLRGDLAAAFRYHPMFWSVPVLALYILYDGTLFSNKKLNAWVLWLLLGGFGVCYCIRLICFLGGGLAI